MQSNTENEFLKSLHDKLDNLEFEPTDQLWESTFERYQQARERKRRPVLGFWRKPEEGRRPVMWIWSGIGSGVIAAGIAAYLLFGTSPADTQKSSQPLQKQAIAADVPVKNNGQAKTDYPQNHITGAPAAQANEETLSQNHNTYSNTRTFTLNPALTPVHKTPVSNDISPYSKPIATVTEEEGIEMPDIPVVKAPETLVEPSLTEIKTAEESQAKKELAAAQPLQKKQAGMRPKDSVHKAEKPAKVKKVLPPSFWVVGAQYNLEQNFRTLSQQGPIGSGYMNTRARESARFTNGAGIFAEYNIHGMLGINLGVNYSKIAFNNNYGAISTVIKDSTAFYDPITGNLAGYVYKQKDTVFYQSANYSAYNFVTIPLQLSITPIQTKKLSISLIGGAAARIAVNRSGTTVNTQDLSPIDIRQTKSIKYANVNWSYHFGFSVNYMAGKHIRIGVQPVIRKSVNSLYLNNYPIKELLTSKGVDFTIGYRF